MIHAILSLALSAAAAPAAPEVARVLDVDSAWAGCSVSFDLVRAGDWQYLAYYDGERRLSVAARRLGEETFTIQKLDELIGWDSHNYPALAVDNSGRIHVAANMHGHPLKYFRSREPHDVATLERVDFMTGEREEHVTYPVFLQTKDGDLVFRYRDGGSGNGADLYNVWDDAAGAWSRLLDVPLHDGLGRMNAYCSRPELGPDGYFHIHWVWRDTPAAETNHDLSHARSADLVHWQTIGGAPVELPMVLETPGLVVDPIPPKGGLLNGAPRLGFDAQAQPLITYYKFDEAGNTQAYLARGEADGTWTIRQISKWDHRYWFEGGGSLPPGDVHLGRPTTREDGMILVPYSHTKHGSGRYLVDGETLGVVGTLPALPTRPAEWTAPRSGIAEARVHWREESGVPAGESTTWVARWEALTSNRDQAREVVPPPSALQLIELRLPTDGRGDGGQRNLH